MIDQSLPDSEKFDQLIEMVLKDISELDFPVRVRFPISGTDNKALMMVAPDAIKKSDFCFQIGAHREGYDMLVSYFWKSGPEEEIREYLKNALQDAEERNKIKASLEELSASVDDKMD